LLVPKDHLQPVLTALRRMDLEVTAIDTAGGAGVSRYIEMMPPSAARRRWIAFAWGTVAALALVAAFLPFITQSLARRAVETRMTTLGPQIAEVAALRRQIAAGKAGDDVIAAERARLGDTLQILATITDVLPDDTVLADLSVRQGKLGFSGRSLAAPRLIAAMASDPTIRNPSFVAPLTRTPDGKADTFVIRAEINP
jgi:general secretion pathway protein L